MQVFPPFLPLPWSFLCPPLLCAWDAVSHGTHHLDTLAPGFQLGVATGRPRQETEGRKERRKVSVLHVRSSDIYPKLWLLLGAFSPRLWWPPGSSVMVPHLDPSGHLAALILPALPALSGPFIKVSLFETSRVNSEFCFLLRPWLLQRPILTCV